MRRFAITLVAAAAFFALSTQLRASIIDNGTYTTDTVSNLDWLDMSYTDGLSYNQTLALISGGSLNGWRFATSAEFNTLMEHAIGFPYINNYSTLQFSQLVSLSGLMGNTYGGPPDYEYLVGYVESSSLSYADARQFGYIRYSFNEGYVRPESHSGWDSAKDSSDSNVGSFLVRTSNFSAIPEPTTITIWLFGGMGLAGYRRRNRR